MQAQKVYLAVIGEQLKQRTHMVRTAAYVARMRQQRELLVHCPAGRHGQAVNLESLLLAVQRRCSLQGTGTMRFDSTTKIPAERVLVSDSARSGC